MPAVGGSTDPVSDGGHCPPGEHQRDGRVTSEHRENSTHDNPENDDACVEGMLRVYHSINLVLHGGKQEQDSAMF